MGLMTSLVGAAQSIFGVADALDLSYRASDSSSTDEPATLYSALRRLALNTNAYTDLAPLLRDYNLDGTAMAGLRNPTNAVAAFYRAVLWSGTIREGAEDSALPLILPDDLTTADNLSSAVHRIWRESNLNRQKSLLAYDTALLGEQILKVVGEGEGATARAYLQVIQPDYMSDLDIDARGYLTYIRLDIPQLRRKADGTADPYTRTEVWDKRGNRYRVWEHTKPSGTGTDQLGTPILDMLMEQVYGADFVPFVQMAYEFSSASPRGVPVVLHALDKIIYLDALTTALHQRLTNHNIPDTVLQSNIFDPATGGPIQTPVPQDVGKVTLGSEDLIIVPSGWTLESTVAQLQYAEHLAVVQAHYQALKQGDLPELVWYDVSEAGNDLSGKALNYKLTPAKSKIDEARGNAEDALIRATQMALTVAQNLGMPGFEAATIGTFEANAFDFWIADRPILPLTESEEAEVATSRATETKTLVDAGASIAGAMEVAGYSTDQIAQATAFEAVPEP